ncbi:MAG: hypothetical protein EAZ07_02990 [Cytophagales bacterium]|nr:MAG: hypothetical protein EAZ07_02990 [Cytophagales bacterium]
MNIGTNSKKSYLPVIIFSIVTLLVTAFRFTPFLNIFPFNFSPVNAIALSCGFYLLNRSYAFLFPLLCIWVSDIFINYIYNQHFTFFYEGFYWQYLSYILIVGLGIVLSKNLKISVVAMGSIIASLGFFLLSNFGTWFSYNFYPNTIDGLMKCYVAGIPFFKTTIISDLLFSTIIFGIMSRVNEKYQATV